MQVIEQFVSAKTGAPSEGEDFVFVGDHFVAIADGVSTNRSAAAKAPSPGQIAVQEIANAIANLPPQVDASRCVAEMSNRVRAARFTHGIAMAASVVVFSVARREIWSVGDCQYLAGPILHSPLLKTDRLLSGLRAYVLESELAQGATVEALIADDKGRTAIEPFLRLQSIFANSASESAFSYGVINGSDVPARLILIHAVPPEVSEIILASDGYPDLKPTLAASEAALSMLLSRDPLRMHSPPATKGLRPGAASFDDRAYMRFRI